jgi:hypothetical protein
MIRPGDDKFCEFFVAWTSFSSAVKFNFFVVDRDAEPSMAEL